MTKNKTLVVGATNNPQRYAWLATARLKQNDIPVVCLGIKNGACAGEPILKGKPELEGINTITLYVGPQRQPEYYDYLLGLKPNRIIFNPGTENSEFMTLARKEGIETEAACTLVMLSAGTYQVSIVHCTEYRVSSTKTALVGEGGYMIEAEAEVKAEEMVR